MGAKSEKPIIQVKVPIEAFLECYQHLLPTQLFVDENGELVTSIIDELNPEPDIEFLWGGRDSGKTRHIAMRLIVDCLTLPYFRCILVRKVANTIKDSQWQQIKDICEEWGVDHLFNFKEHPLEIICCNGNKFLARGMDEPAKLKSVSNPSHCWAEEMNQLDKDDFIVILTSLRYNGGKVKTWCSFNPECDGDFQEFWLYKMFFENHHSKMYGSFTGKWEHKMKKHGFGKAKTIFFVYRCTWTTYHDNPYCRDERIVFLEQMAELDSYYATVFTNGKWGNRKVTDPFCYCFNENLHVGRVEINYGLELILSFDFNVNPITCGVYQYDPNQNIIYCVESIKLENSNIYNLCDYIRVHYSDHLLLVTGDATGNNSSALVKDDLNYYKIIKMELGLMETQMKEPSINPPITENRVLVNSVFKKVAVIFDSEKAKDLIYDCKNVTVNDVGKIDKGDRNNPKKRADHLDHFRYYLNSFHKWVLKIPA